MMKGSFGWQKLWFITFLGRFCEVFIVFWIIAIARSGSLRAVLQYSCIYPLQTYRQTLFTRFSFLKWWLFHLLYISQSRHRFWSLIFHLSDHWTYNLAISKPSSPKSQMFLVSYKHKQDHFCHFFCQISIPNQGVKSEPAMYLLVLSLLLIG